MRVDVQQGLNQASDSLRAASTKGSDGGKKLEKQDFLNLMMTQMAHQDPLNPMDTDKMMAQVSQLGSVEQLQMINQKLEKLTSMQGDVVRNTAYSFLDKDVEIGSNTLPVSGGIANSGSFSIDGDADKVVAYITAQDGHTVRTLDLGDKARGTHYVSWDGKDDDGDALPDGVYKYEISAHAANGEKISANLYKQGRVSGVQFDNGRPLVQVNGEYLPLDKVKGINLLSEKKFDSASMMPIKKDLPIKTMNLTLKNLGSTPGAAPTASLNPTVPASATPLEIKREVPGKKLDYPLNAEEPNKG